VGNAKHAMLALKSKGLDKVIKKIKNPLLGICVGMQLLYDYSEEGQTNCLGIIEGRIRRFDKSKLIVPQVGWNKIQFASHPLFEGIDPNSWFYSVHSYYAEIGIYTISTSTYGVEYSSAIQKNNFFGTQYHPEKSSKNGAIVLKNFIML
jgi:glutamine amidotransferase